MYEARWAIEHEKAAAMNTYMFLELNGSTFRSSHLGGTILDAVSTVYSADDANYFLLESQNTLPQVNLKLDANINFEINYVCKVSLLNVFCT